MSGPMTGSLDRLTLPLLRDHLTRYTATPEACWFALWSGFGHTAGRWGLDSTFTLPGGPYWLFAGAVTDVVGLSVEFDSGGSDEPALSMWQRMGMVHSPTIWWPQDRAWVVHSMFGYDSTIVGGAPPLIDALVSDPDIEALQVDPDTSLLANGDTVNGCCPSGGLQPG